jgi:hypothetical protein
MMDVSGGAVSFPISLSKSNVYAGSSSGVFGHVDGMASSSLFMNPTGIARDGSDNLYVNDWYMVPGEVDMGSSWSSEYGEKSKSGSGSGSHVGSGTKGAVSVTAGKGSSGNSDTSVSSDGGTGKSSGTGSNSESDVSDMGVLRMSDVNWGHEPQYLHNVRKIVLSDNSGAGSVTTIAGGNIRKSL